MHMVQAPIRCVEASMLTSLACAMLLSIHPIDANLLPTGARVTPAVTPGAVVAALEPDLPGHPGFVAGQPVSIARSPDGKTALVLTSGYNRSFDVRGQLDPVASSEYVFVYDLSSFPPVKRQVLQLANTFGGIAWHPAGTTFYVSGGVDDVLHEYHRDAVTGRFAEVTPAITLGHAHGLGLDVAPMAAGVAIDATGTRAAVANLENDSVTLVDLAARRVVTELDLRPGGGRAGGEFPVATAWVGSKLYVSSQRDRELVVVETSGAARVLTRIPVGSQPGKLLLDRAGARLFVVNAGSDSVSTIDTRRDRVVDDVPVGAPAWLAWHLDGLKGANPNGLVLAPDERTLYVSLGGLNAIAVVDLGEHQVVGLVPAGWYPHDVTLAANGTQLISVHGKSQAGPNPGGCRDTPSIAPGSSNACRGRNLYSLQLMKGGLVSAPVPGSFGLAWLTWQVAVNNRLVPTVDDLRDALRLGLLGSRIDHVIYIVKENRTYDQILGDLGRGDGDPAYNVFPEAITPNFHALARSFVTLDRFLDTGGVSGDGWNWTTAARTSDFTEKTVPVNYAGRGLSYDWEGTSRNINVGIPTLAGRLAANPVTPDDADLLPGTADVAEPEGREGQEDVAYLWDAALAAGLSVRNYGFFGDGLRYELPAANPAYVPVSRHPFAEGAVQFFPAKPALAEVSDPYFRTFDMNLPDYWLEKEWEREFDDYEAAGTLPALTLLRLPHDHFGNFATAIDGVNTPDTQMADNDYAVGRVIERVAHSRFAGRTVIFIIEDDAQNGGDHVDAHRSTAFVAGAFVKQGAVVSTDYDTVSMVRTIELLLGLAPLGLTDATARPMADVFELGLWARPWSFAAIVPAVLRSTALPLPGTGPTAQPRGDAASWARAMRSFDFSSEDRLDSDRFNQVLWRGLMQGERR
jgi:YVTN family beta-propeller protein